MFKTELATNYVQDALERDIFNADLHVAQCAAVQGNQLENLKERSFFTEPRFNTSAGEGPGPSSSPGSGVHMLEAVLFWFVLFVFASLR